MSSKTANTQMVLRFRYIGAGIILSTIWWVLSVSNIDRFTLQDLISAAVVIGGFVPVLVIMAWIGGRVSSAKDQANPPASKTWVWAIVSLIYPVAVLVGLIWTILSPVPWLSHSLTHPIVLILNLMGVFLIGPFMSLTGLTDKFDSSQNEEGSNPRNLILLFVWWLWHLPFIFLNGLALSKINFSTLLLSLYLASTLMLSYIITWGNDRQTLKK